MSNEQTVIVRNSAQSLRAHEENFATERRTTDRQAHIGSVISISGEPSAP